jgi:capsular exopolysaccharide synthesis family protein
MSRIFDALRQSEKDKQPGAERWSRLPGMTTAEPNLSAGDESVRELELPAISEEESLSFLAPPVAPSIPLESDSEVAATQSADFPTASEIPLFRPAGNDKATTEIQRLLADLLPNAGPLSATSPYVAGPGPQIDVSELKVITEASIQSPFLVALNHERELGAEKFRVLGARLSNIRMGATLKVLQVTSSVVGEGKTLTSVNLAMTLAKRFAQKVVLVEGDLRKPAVCAMLGLTDRLGIGDWWQEQNASISNFMLRIGDTGMCLLPAGNAVHPASVLQSQRLPDMLAELARQFDWVIIDTPPLLPMADSNQWSRVADGTLFVVRRGAVSRAALRKAVESIDNPKLVGIVLNDASDYDRVDYYDRYCEPRITGDSAQGKAISR